MIKENFLNKLHSWYSLNKRQLPFRETNDPYFIWLSEIILQQTRVNQGLPYYYKFTQFFPTVFDLAKATEEDVLNAWQGLGYYSRARNLHFTAKYVVNELNGKFPVSYSELIKLKGIGDYTASAISSFSSKEVVPVLDGNVYRFIGRLYGIATPINTPKAIKEFKLILNKLIDVDNPDIFNQAIIEFGALYCKPISPDCDNCIFADNCFAFQSKKVTEFPVKIKKKKSIDRFLSFYAIIDNGSIYLEKRTGNAIWKNLYEFPNHESKDDFENEILPENLISSVEIDSVSKGYKHLLSHQNIYAKLFVCSTKNGFEEEKKWIKIRTSEIENYPIHRLMEKMIEGFDIS